MWTVYFRVLLLCCWSIQLSMEQENCSDSGIWGEWGAWGACPVGSASVLNFKWRKRYCMKQPPDCVMVSEYTCLGTYTQLEECKAQTTSSIEADTTTTTAISGNITVPATPLPSDNVTVSMTAPTSSNVTLSATSSPAANVTMPMTAAPSSNVTVPTTAPSSSNVTVPTTSLITANVTMPTMVPPSSNVTMPTSLPSDNVTVPATAPITADVTVPTTALPSDNATVPTMPSVTADVTTPTTAPPLNDTTVSMTSLPTANETMPATQPSTIDVTASTTPLPATNTTMPITAPPTAPPGSPCTICPILTPVYFVTAEAKDGKLLLDHYTGETGCRNVYVQCASETSNERVAVIFNGNLSNPFAIASGTVEMTLQCNTQTQWTYANETFDALNVSCIVLLAENTTTDITTTTIPLTSTTSAAPSCTTCGSLSVGWVKESLMTNGMVVMDHSRINGCDVLLLTCLSDRSDAAVDVFDSTGFPLAAGVGIVNVTFLCSQSAKWLIFGGQEVIQILCVTPKATTTTSIPTTATTTALSTATTVTSNENCTKCSILNVGTTNEEGYINGDIITNRVFVNCCMQIYVTCVNPQPDGYTLLRSITNITLAVGNGTANVTLECDDRAEWQTPDEIFVPGVVCVAKVEHSTTVPQITTSMPTTTTIDLNASCRMCPNLKPLAIPNTVMTETNGNLAIQHFYGADGCRDAQVFCSGHATDEAMVSFNGDFQDVVVSGLGKISLLLMCTAKRTWSMDGIAENVTSVTCALTAAVNVTTSPLPSTLSSPTRTTLPDTGSCAGCAMPTIGVVTMIGFKQGNVIMDVEEIGGCTLIEIFCTNDVSTLFTMILSMANGTLASGDGLANVTLECNNASEWQTTNGTVVPGILCAAEAAADIATSVETTTTAQVTTTQSTTTILQNCVGTQWNQWESWTECSDTCGACGTRQRFRGCLQTGNGCDCSGSSYEKVVCNTVVCTYPRSSCCDGYTMGSLDNQFACIPVISTR